MKLLVAAALFAGFLARSADAQVPVGPGAVKMGKVQVEVVSTPEYQLSSGPKKRSESKQWLEVEVEFDTVPPMIDELTFKYTIMIGKSLLDGEVTHVNIPQQKSHFSVVYVSPSAIARLTGGKPLNAGNVENIWVDVSKSGQKLAQTVTLKASAMPNLPHLSGMVLNKMETPFAPLFYDRYPAIRAGR